MESWLPPRQVVWPVVWLLTTMPPLEKLNFQLHERLTDRCICHVDIYISTDIIFICVLRLRPWSNYKQCLRGWSNDSFHNTEMLNFQSQELHLLSWNLKSMIMRITISMLEIRLNFGQKTSSSDFTVGSKWFWGMELPEALLYFIRLIRPRWEGIRRMWSQTWGLRTAAQRLAGAGPCFCAATVWAWNASTQVVFFLGHILFSVQIDIRY